jgi:hypothetical protein
MNEVRKQQLEEIRLGMGMGKGQRTAASWPQGEKPGINNKHQVPEHIYAHS